jgi:hypothetical protein
VPPVAATQAPGEHEVEGEEQPALEREDDPLACRVTAWTTPPSTAASGGTAVRTTNGLTTRTRSSTRPVIRRPRAST